MRQKGESLQHKKLDYVIELVVVLRYYEDNYVI